MYDTYVLPRFVVAVLEMREYNMLRLQKAANSLADEYSDSFIYIKDGRIYVLFSGVHTKETEKRIAPGGDLQDVRLLLRGERSF